MTLIGVRVIGCVNTGATSIITAGVDWVAANAVKPAVANISLRAADPSPTLDAAVGSLIDSGVAVVAAAGNENHDACLGSPARVPAAITVGATTQTDARWFASNFGGCVDLFAPGANIVSTWSSTNTAIHELGSTSMAAPHVTGAAALHLQHEPSATPAAVAHVLTSLAMPGKVGSAGAGSPNRLLYLRFPPSECGRMLPGEALQRDQWVKSCGGNVMLALQTDQNVVLYESGRAIWSAPNTLNRGTAVLHMQTDGNLVAYDGAGQYLWASGTAGNLEAWVQVQDDCNLVVYRGPFPGGPALWASNTSCATGAFAPVAGAFEENTSCSWFAFPKWTFCQHRSGYHAPGAGVAGADDTHAWDINQASNADAGKPVYPTAPGTVVRYGGTAAPGGSSGTVLIEHNSNGRIWWSGYLHMAGIAVSLGQQVTTGTVIGYIGRAGADNDHLHFVTYNGTNTWGGLRSYDAQLTVR